MPSDWQLEKREKETKHIPLGMGLVLSVAPPMKWRDVYDGHPSTYPPQVDYWKFATWEFTVTDGYSFAVNNISEEAVETIRDIVPFIEHIVTSLVVAVSKKSMEQTMPKIASTVRKMMVK